uniref:RNase H type-1 domain-containing protein n=1 Tax=Quercus lobata TaxID=97700 RepID=A0A7N2LQE5_QUELO
MHPKLQYRTTITTLAGWKPTPFPFLTLNTDGSAKGNTGHAGAGGIIRDHWGNWIRGFSINIGITHSMMAELWAIREGLKFAWSLSWSDLGWSKLITFGGKLMGVLTCWQRKEQSNRSVKFSMTLVLRF